MKGVPPAAPLHCPQPSPSRSPINDAHTRSFTAGYYKLRALLRWVLNLSIGIVVACLAVAITFTTHRMVSWRFSVVNALIDSSRGGTAEWALPFLAFLGTALLLGLCATLPVVFVEPVAGGSGIPEVKSILNGVKLPRVTRFKTLVCKVVGNAFSVSAGLPVGYEGPMLHVGVSARG